MKHLISISFVCLFTMLVSSCSEQEQKPSIEEELKAIEYSIDNCIGWFKNKDLDLLLKIVANDSNFISVHPTDNVVRGRKGFEKSIPVFMNPKFQYVRHDISDLKITLSSNGDIAWFYCRLNDINTWDSQPANWENARWTGVLEKRDEFWVIVQQHFSFAENS